MNAMTGFTPLTGTPTESAEVVARDAEHFTIRRHGREEAARRAFSCLVEPEPGDIVLLGQAGAETYVLAVLARTGGAPMRLAMPDGATIASDGGRLNLAAATLSMDAGDARLAARSLDVAAGRTEAHLGRVAMIAEAIETVAQRIVGRFRRSYRFVEENEQLRARDVDHRASGHLHLRGGIASVQGDALVKVQADQIHLG